MAGLEAGQLENKGALPMKTGKEPCGITKVSRHESP